MDTHQNLIPGTGNVFVFCFHGVHFHADHGTWWAGQDDDDDDEDDNDDDDDDDGDDNGLCPALVHGEKACPTAAAAAAAGTTDSLWVPIVSRALRASRD
jgi:hypothetical protein